MIALPIPDKRSRVRYLDLSWRGRNLGELVAKLTRGKQRSDYRAHLDPDLRRDIWPRKPGWCPTLGQIGSAQGHLRKQGVGPGDLFLFWASFRRVDEDLRWKGGTEHHIWGWLQIGDVVSVDEVLRNGGKEWGWAMTHPHLSFPCDPTNTLYIASGELSLPGPPTPGAGVFDYVDDALRLTAPDATKPSEWSLPIGFLPKGRPPLSYHKSPDRWSQCGQRARLRSVSRGQEFVLDLALYPELIGWLTEIIAGGRRTR